MRATIALTLILCTTLMAADRKILVHGHRGARAVLPENTIPAFEHAIAAGADVLELDLAVTKDNVLVVSHDPVINDGICTGPKQHVPIRQLTLAEVKQYDCGSRTLSAYPKQKAVPGTRIPTLDEVLALSKRGTFHFNIETKLSADKPEYTPPSEEFAKLVLQVVRKHKLEKRVQVQSFDFRTLHAMKKLAPEIPLNALYSGPAKDFVAIAREAGASTIAPQYKLVTKEQVDKAHAAGLKVVPWTANDPEAWRMLIDAGVDEIITDDPAALISFLKKPRA
jgi:glycerophosphoryl diester phosphodiesterase